MGKLLVGVMVSFTLLMATTMSTAHSAAAQGLDESVSGMTTTSGVTPQYSGGVQYGAGQYGAGQYGAGQYGMPDVEAPAIAAGARDAAKDATESAGEGVVAFEKGVGAAELVRKHGITRLPDTGGAPLTMLAAGLALIGGSAVVRRLGR